MADVRLVSGSTGPIEAPTPADARHDGDPAAGTTGALRGRALTLARLGGLAATALAMGLIVGTLPQSFDYYRAVCVDGDCLGRLTPEGMARLQAHGLSAAFFAASSL